MTLPQPRPDFDLCTPSTLLLDLDNQKPKELRAIHEAFEDAMKNSTAMLGQLPVTTGWHDITPSIAIELLKRNRPGANRHLDPATVFYYAIQMRNKDWKRTGQPIIFDKTGVLLDAQHRLYAVVVSGETIQSYVLTDIEPETGLFAYIDNGRVRTAATALQTAGFNGVSPVIAKVIKFAEEVRLGKYNPSGTTKLHRPSPADILHLVQSYPNARHAARSAASDWSGVVTYLGRKDIVAYVGMRIIDLHGEDVADDFFEDIMDGSSRPADHPITAFRKVMDDDRKKPKQMRREHLAANLVRTFNAWRKGVSLARRWTLTENEDFPAFIESDDLPQAAE